jgi:hypothetical protein
MRSLGEGDELFNRDVMSNPAEFALDADSFGVVGAGRV